MTLLTSRCFLPDDHLVNTFHSRAPQICEQWQDGPPLRVSNLQSIWTTFYLQIVNVPMPYHVLLASHVVDFSSLAQALIFQDLVPLGLGAMLDAAVESDEWNFLDVWFGEC